MQRIERDGFVYVVVTNFGPHQFMKIGTTIEGIKKRIHSLQTGCPNKIIPHVRIEGTASKVARIEKRLHDDMVKFKATGEWFRCNKASVRELRFNMFVAAHQEDCEIYQISNPKDPDYSGERVNFRYQLHCEFASKYKRLTGKFLINEMHDKYMEDL